MGVWPERNTLGVGQGELARDMSLRGGDYVGKNEIPFAVEPVRCVDPRILLGLERNIRPGMVAVRRDMQWRAVAAERQREMIHRGDTWPALMSGSFRCSAFQRIASQIRVWPEG